MAKRNFILQIDADDTEYGWEHADLLVAEIKDDLLDKYDGAVRVIHSSCSRTEMGQGRTGYTIHYIGWTPSDEARA